MHPGNDYVPIWPADPVHLAEQLVQVFDVIHDERAEDAVEMVRRERQRLRKIVHLEEEIAHASFFARLPQHLRGEIECGDARSRTGHADGMTAGPATEIEDVEPVDVPE
jgi:hypothetical protein